MASPEKLIELQHQMRLNQEEYADYLKELTSWEDQMQKKEVALKETSDSASSQAQVSFLITRRIKIPCCHGCTVSYWVGCEIGLNLLGRMHVTPLLHTIFGPCWLKARFCGFGWGGHLD